MICFLWVGLPGFLCDPVSVIDKPDPTDRTLFGLWSSPQAQVFFARADNRRVKQLPALRDWSAIALSNKSLKHDRVDLTGSCFKLREA
jgi:hypothetical protein